MIIKIAFHLKNVDITSNKKFINGFEYEVLRVDEKTVRAVVELLANKKKEYISIIHETKDARTEETFKRYLCGMNVFMDTICSFARRNNIDVSDIDW